MVYEIYREVIKTTTKKEKGLVMVRYKDTDTNEIFEDFFETTSSKLTIQFIHQEQPEKREYTATEYNKFWENAKDEIHEDIVKVDYDKENKCAYIPRTRIARLCNKYNTWDKPEGTREKYFNIDIEVEDNELLKYVYIYNPNKQGDDYVEMEIDLTIDTTPNDELLEEVEMIPDNTQFYIDPYTLEKVPVDEWNDERLYNRNNKGKLN